MSTETVHYYPTILMTPKAQFQMTTWTEKASGEISGFGLIEEKYDGDLLSGIVVRELFLTKQVCSDAHTTIDDTDMAWILAELSKDPTIKLGQLRLWWHSHADGGVFWSDTDKKTSANLSDKGECNTLSIVVNKKGDMKAKYIMMSPIVMTLDDLPIKLYLEDKSLQDSCNEEFEGKVTEAVTGTGTEYKYDSKSRTWETKQTNNGNGNDPGGNTTTPSKGESKRAKKDGGGESGSSIVGPVGSEAIPPVGVLSGPTEEDLDRIIEGVKWGQIDAESAFFKLQTAMAAAIRELESGRSSALDKPPFSVLKKAVEKSMIELMAESYIYAGTAGYNPGDAL